MWRDRIFLILGCILHAHSVLSWSCVENSECSFIEGAVCRASSCVCAAGQQLVQQGTACVDSSPYYTSPCVEDYQCSSLVTNFECRRIGNATEGNCFCRDGFHYQNGRCWQSADYGTPCSRDEECIGTLRDPFSLSCDVGDGTCGCASGYYRRQRAECRKIGYVVGDGCVLDEDCQFVNGKCHASRFQCYDASVTDEQLNNLKTENQNDGGYEVLQDGDFATQYGAECDISNPCASSLVCSSAGICVCPRGYYSIENGTRCYAELSSRSTEEQCIGLFAEVRDEICTCQANFFFDENMRDCIKVVRAPNDSCMTDSMCHTFGAAVRCGEPTLPWSIRYCECLPELAVWDETRSMCRLFAGIGEACQANSDCLAGNLEIECIINNEGEGVCACPEGTSAQDGLCLTSGLALGDSCQASLECTETANTVCNDGRCSCGQGYEGTEDFCTPTLGGACTVDSECLKDTMVCEADEGSQNSTCRCNSLYVEYDSECWPPVSENDEVCNVTAQCKAVMGEQSVCEQGRCICQNGFHYRDGGCWPQIGLFETCSRTSECFLTELSERVVCRNSLCQCSFDYPYSEQLHTCVSSASTTMGSLLTILIAVYFVLSH